MKKIGLTMMAMILALGCHMMQAEATSMTLPSVVQLDAVYYLNGDSQTLITADADTDGVKYVSSGTQSGFEAIDIVVEGMSGETFTLLFGMAYDSETMPKMILVGDETANHDVAWIPLSRISAKASAEYGTLYESNSIGVTMTAYKKGIRTRIGASSSTQAAGVKIEFAEIGRDDVYTVSTVYLIGTDGLERIFRVLCINRHRESLESGVIDEGMFDEAIFNETSGYYEINTLTDRFINGQVIDSSVLNDMRDSGNKYTFFMEGYTVLVDRISDTTAAQGDVAIKTDSIPNDLLRDRYAEAAGGSIITFKIESGFVNDKVTYAVNLNGDTTDGMSESEQSKWTDGKKVFCYIVNKSDLEKSENEGMTNPIVGNNDTLPVSIQGGAIYIETDPESFNANQQMMMLTLQEIPVRSIAFEVNEGSAVDSQNVYMGDYANEPAIPVKAGHEFAGWYRDQDLRMVFDFESAISEDTTVYVKWKTLASKRQNSSNVENDGDEDNEENEGVDIELPVEDIRVEFTDTIGHWAQTAIHDMASHKIINGYPDTTFGPDRRMSRAEFATMLIRTLGRSERLGESSFHDIKTDDWYCGFIEAGLQLGLFAGYPDGTFGPTHWMTCQQAMTVMERALSLLGVDAVVPACEVSGDGFITRAQATVMMHQLYNFLPE